MADGTGIPETDHRSFRLADLKTGKPDARGRMVLDILWSTDEFVIFKTRVGISPHFSDDPKVAREQKDAYLALGEGIGEFNHLIDTFRPRSIPFMDRPMPTTAKSESDISLYERELARCIAQALLGQVADAKASLARLTARVSARASNRGRVVHLAINILLVSMAVAGGVGFAISGYQSTFGYNVHEMAIAIMMGSVGALFSTTARLQSMEVDPTVGQMMHWIYGGQRVLVGSLGALIIYFGFRSGILNGLLQPIQGSGSVPPATDADFNIYWLSFVCVLAGFSERLVPNLLNNQADAALARAEATPGNDAKGGKPGPGSADDA